MRLPLANATLARVGAGGLAADYDQEATEDTAKWAGSEEAFYEETSEQLTEGRSADVVVRRNLFALTERLPIEFDPGDTLSFTVHRPQASVLARKPFTAAIDDVITSAAHGYLDGDQVVLTELGGATSLDDDVVYYVRDATTNTFKLAAASGGAAIDITATGSGTAQKAIVEDVQHVERIEYPGVPGAVRFHLEEA